MDAVTDEQWSTYREAIQALRAAGMRFLLGGGFALATYVGRWRNTKDIDFYIMQQDRDKAVEALSKAGFEDYFSATAVRSQMDLSQHARRRDCGHHLGDGQSAGANGRAMVRARAGGRRCAARR